jgi:hypothetical protein
MLNASWVRTQQARHRRGSSEALKDAVMWRFMWILLQGITLFARGRGGSSPGNGFRVRVEFGRVLDQPTVWRR